jgi:WD40 repeat protein
VGSLAFTPDGQILVAGSADHTVSLWQVADGTPLRTLSGHEGYVFTIAMARDGQTFATGSFDGTIRLWGVR